jgi:hypothetical protein
MWRSNRVGTVDTVGEHRIHPPPRSSFHLRRTKTKARETGQQVEKGMQSDKLLILSRMLLPALQKGTDKAAEAEGRLRCAEGALALERYRLQNNGAVPDELTRLIPAIVPSVPADPIDGAPLRFRKLDAGYVIYSIGIDGTDDGGMERGGSGSSGVRKWPPSREPKRGAAAKSNATSGAGKSYDITFTVER